MEAASAITSCDQCPLPMEKNVDDLLTLEQAAKKVKISIRMLQKEMAAGSVSYVKIGRLDQIPPL